MKKYLTTLIVFIFCGCIIIPRLTGQAPGAMTYQAEVRDDKGKILKDENLDVTIGILEGSIGTIPVLTYTYSVTTDEYGLFTVTIGNPIDSYDPLYSLDWETQPHYLEVQVTDNKNNTYALGTSQFLSVPYALHAKTAETATIDNVNDDDANPLNELQNLTLWGDNLRLSITNDEVSLENYITPWEVWGDDYLRFTGAIDIGDEYTSGAALRVDGNITLGKRGENLGTYGMGGPDPESGISLRGGTLGGGQIRLYGPEHIAHSDEVHLLTGGNKRIIIKPDGKVGIGTSAPNYKLDVNGDLNFTGELLYNGNPFITNDADADPTNETQDLGQVLIEGNDAGGNRITNLADPIVSQDAATKAYVDELMSILIQVIDLSDLLEAGVSISDLINEGVSISDLINEGVSISDLIASGANLLDLFNLGIGVGTLEQNGASQQALEDAGLIGFVEDIDGNTYKWVKIGDQVWMAENLKTTKLNDGNDIPFISNSSFGLVITPAYSYVPFSGDYKNTYGCIYNIYALDTEMVCPDSWHVPTNAEWNTLENYLRDNGYNYDGTTSGNKFAKALASTTNWIYSSYTGVPGNTDYPEYRNSTGFTALPGGHITGTVVPDGTGSDGYWWTAPDNYLFPVGFSYKISYNDTDIVYWQAPFSPMRAGYSVRCVKDQ